MERKDGVNNAFYDTLGEGWYTASNHPIALLRAENAIRGPWIVETIQQKFGSNAQVLDVGCGGGFLSNLLASSGFQVTGIDLSNESLEIAKQQDKTKSANYLFADATALPFEDASFDVVCALDLLEHVENPQAVIKEASRVLKKDGLFFFHTFNRNLLSWLLVIKGVEWAVPNTPDRIHVLRLFIKPQELKAFCENSQISIQEIRGLKPKLSLPILWNMLTRRKVPENFAFEFTPSLRTGYIGLGRKI
jgi:2-polyprenyl-6-hydroxyphenyl methylase/3-demethylubiquinone-9 3-methyltransferase